MGLDIHISSTLSEESQFQIHQQFYQRGKVIGLSRTFCNFMSRQNVISGEPELDQIGRMRPVAIATKARNS